MTYAQEWSLTYGWPLLVFSVGALLICTLGPRWVQAMACNAYGHHPKCGHKQ